MTLFTTTEILILFRVSLDRVPSRSLLYFSTSLHLAQRCKLLPEKGWDRMSLTLFGYGEE